MFVALFKTFGMQKDDYNILLRMFKNKVICQKAVYKGWCKESSCRYKLKKMFSLDERKTASQTLLF